MTEYIRTEKNGGTLLSAENNASSPILTIMTAEEFAERKNEFLHVKDVLHGKGAARYCKADVFANCIWGTVRIPNKSDDTKPPVSFLFYLVDSKLVLIEDVGNIKQWIKVQAEKLCDFNSSDTLLFRIIESSFENDLMYLSHIEKKIENLEDSISENLPNDFFDKITKERKKLSEMHAFYEQISDMSDILGAYGKTQIIKETELWSRLGGRTDRLGDHIRLLQENILQLRELYQAKQDAKQNKVMCILTIVTTLFLPLTLLTGWYGMNFRNMPELQWEHGYLGVIVIAVVSVILEIIYFKKKKMF